MSTLCGSLSALALVGSWNNRDFKQHRLSYPIKASDQNPDALVIHVGDRAIFLFRRRWRSIDVPKSPSSLASMGGISSKTRSPTTGILFPLLDCSSVNIRSSSCKRAGFSSPQDFLALNFLKVRRTFCGNRKGSPAMGEPGTTRYRTNSAIDYNILRFMGRAGFEPARSQTPADFKSLALSEYAPYYILCVHARFAYI